MIFSLGHGFSIGVYSGPSIQDTDVKCALTLNHANPTVSGSESTNAMAGYLLGRFAQKTAIG